MCINPHLFNIFACMRLPMAYQLLTISYHADVQGFQKNWMYHAVEGLGVFAETVSLENPEMSSPLLYSCVYQFQKWNHPPQNTSLITTVTYFRSILLPCYNLRCHPVRCSYHSGAFRLLWCYLCTKTKIRCRKKNKELKLCQRNNNTMNFTQQYSSGWNLMEVTTLQAADSQLQKEGFCFICLTFVKHPITCFLLYSKFNI